MSPWLEYREMRDWQMWSQKILLSLSSASSSSLLGGLLSFVKLTSIGLLGLQCINIWGATDNPGVLMDQLSGWRLQAGNILRPRPGPTFVLFVVLFFFLLKNSRTPTLAGGFSWTEYLIHPQSVFLWSHRNNFQFWSSQKEILLFWLIKQNRCS